MLPSGLPTDSQKMALVDQFGERGRITVVGKTGLDAHLRQRVGQQVVGAAIQCGRRNNVVAGFGDGLDRIGDGRHAGGHGKAADATFHFRHACLEHGVGRIHDAAIDVAGHLQVEQVGAVLRVVEGVCHRLVDRHGHGLGGGIGCIAAMNGDGFNLHVAVSSKLRILGHAAIVTSPAMTEAARTADRLRGARAYLRRRRRTIVPISPRPANNMA